ncbi:MAG: S41 family peptidase [Candidatus Aphodosoma sp.]
MKKIRFTILLSFLAISLTIIAGNKDKTQEGESKFNQLKNIETYANVLRELSINYVDDINYDNLLNFALEGMLYSLDPYTIFIPEVNNQYIRTINKGEYMGVGVVIQKIDGEIHITKVLKDMPAYNAGIIVGDIMVSINGKKCAPLELSQVSDMLRGTSSEKLKIEIKRYGNEKNIIKEVTRNYVSENSIPVALEIAPGTGYIKITSFVENTSSTFKTKLDSLVTNNGIENLIIDLRDNGGGILQQAVNIASLFLPKSTKIVDLKKRNQKNTQTYSTINVPKYPNMKLAFILNKESASASELLAGSFQDLDKALIVGERSFGKALVQNITSTGYDTYLKLTIGKYILPSGRCIQAIDYTSRHDGNKERVLVDSLLNEYKTKNGRIVYDGSGINPDTAFEIKEELTICDYLQYYNMFYKYANKYHYEHKTIAQPMEFEVSDSIYEDFCNFVIANNFNYSLTSNMYLQSLESLIKAEGYEEIAKEHIDKLKELLKPNVKYDLQRLKPTIKRKLENEIITRYYYSQGSMIFSLKSDEWIEKTIDIINKDEVYQELLKP